MKVDIGVMHPETSEHQKLPASPQELGERQEQSLLTPLRKNQPYQGPRLDS